MFKKYLFTLLIFANAFNVVAQNTDSVTLVNTKWKTQKIAKKTKLVTHHFNQKNLFLANQNISYIEVKNKGRYPVFAVGYEEKELKTTADLAIQNNAFAAINGTFFDIKNGGSVDFIKSQGIKINDNRLEKNGNRAMHQKATIVIENGKLDIKKWDNDPNWEQKLVETDVMVSGPLLTINRIDEVLDSSAFNKLRHPRSAIGLKPNGKIILLTVDGRHENSAGMSLFELTKIMKWLGCTSAINLDGGGSTTLWVNGITENGVINYPSDNKKWDNEGMRKVANIILLKK